MKLVLGRTKEGSVVFGFAWRKRKVKELREKLEHTHTAVYRLRDIIRLNPIILHADNTITGGKK